MTSNTAPSGMVSASSEYSGMSAFQAFDGAAGTMWGTAINAGTPAWLEYDFPAPKTVTSYQLTFVNGSLWQRGPRDWQFQAWNGSSWVNLQSISGETCWGSPAGAPAPTTCATTNNARTYTVAAPGSYSRYRLYFTMDNYMSATPTMITLGTVVLNGF